MDYSLKFFFFIQGLGSLVSSYDPYIPLERKRKEKPTFSAIQWSHLSGALNVHLRCRQHGVLKSMWLLTVNQVNVSMRIHSLITT